MISSDNNAHDWLFPSCRTPGFHFHDMPRIGPLSEDEVVTLGNYNRDLSMGRTHRPDYVEKMEQLQRRFDSSRGAARRPPPPPNRAPTIPTQDSNAPTVIALVFLLIALVVLVWILVGVAQAFHPPNV